MAFSSHSWATDIIFSLLCCFHRSRLFKLIWLLHIGSLNHWTWACGPSSCSSTSFLSPGTTTCRIPPLALPLFECTVFLPRNPFPSLPTLLSTSGWCVLYNTVLIRLTAAVDIVIQLTALEAEVHRDYKRGKSNDLFFCFVLLLHSEMASAATVSLANEITRPLSWRRHSKLQGCLGKPFTLNHQRKNILRFFLLHRQYTLCAVKDFHCDFHIFGWGLK